ncbi:MAG: hypothetical protein HZB19_15085 [Chloroflexi bacterium]|nr:hypothetical protein [Chloroflexota bacterium]
MTNLWSSNHPRNFWLCQPDLPDEVWQEAIFRALPLLGLNDTVLDVDSLLEFTLGERQFGPNHHHLGFVLNLYYMLKPLLPKSFTWPMRRLFSTINKKEYLKWPIEPRFAQFQWEILRQALLISKKQEIAFQHFWPEAKRFAFVLTHDIESAEGQHLAPVLADLEESLGFSSSFNFVPERYPLDLGLIKDLQQRGFEIGVHGLKHDGRLFCTYTSFSKRAIQINRYLHKFRAVGFRSPYTHRNPEWMQLLNLEYDLSFFDTDPYEPMPGGVMSIWPFRAGRFLELPYTLPQDSTLFNVLGETSPQIWLEKTTFIRKYYGMALMLVHPDYSASGMARQCYAAFLQEMKARGEYWHAIPCQVASWWKTRILSSNIDGIASLMAHATLTEDSINIKNSLELDNFSSQANPALYLP